MSDTTDAEHFDFSPHGGFSEPPELLTDSYWGLKGKEKSANMVIMLIKSDLLLPLEGAVAAGNSVHSNNDDFSH